MTKNKYTLRYVLIPLTKTRFTRVDIIDSDLATRKWYACIGKTNIYAQRIDSKKTIKLHRIILSRMLNRELSSLERVDHRNNNSLDNRRSNLRLATVLENNRNARIRKDNTSGFKGVYWDEHAQKWRARIRINKKYKYLGCHDTPESAYQAYCEAAKKYHGEFARFK